MQPPEARMPPHSLEAEQSVLGALLLDPEAVFKAMEILRPEDFYHETNRIIYQAVLDMVNRNHPVDLVTLTNELESRDKLEMVGGAVYVSQLASFVPTAANVDHYARIVAEKALLRQLIEAGSLIANRSFEEAGPANELLDEAEGLIFGLAQRGRRTAFTPLKEVLLATLDALEELAANKEDQRVLPTFADLDRLLLGLHPSDLVIVAARPGMGKTAFCLNIAMNVALKKQVPVALFSLEMAKEQLAMRLLSAEGLVDQKKLRLGQLEADEWQRLVKAASRLAEAPIYIDDTPGINPLEIRAKARRLKSEKGLGLIIIDYLQLMQGHRRTENRQQEIADISRAMKSLARELEVPVIALSQLSRAVEQTHDKRPNLSHLRESGALEQDSDAVIFIHRPEYYDQDTEKKGIAEIIVAKHRNGPVGMVEMAFLAQFTKFMDLAREDVS